MVRLWEFEDLRVDLFKVGEGGANREGGEDGG